MPNKLAFLKLSYLVDICLTFQQISYRKLRDLCAFFFFCRNKRKMECWSRLSLSLIVVLELVVCVCVCLSYDQCVKELLTIGQSLKKSFQCLIYWCAFVCVILASNQCVKELFTINWRMQKAFWTYIGCLNVLNLSGLLQFYIICYDCYFYLYFFKFVHFYSN